jgi:hypothetical protein
VPSDGNEPVDVTLPEAQPEAISETTQPEAEQTTEPPVAAESSELAASTAVQESAPTPSETEQVKQEAPAVASSVVTEAPADAASSADLSVALAKSAENAASAYKSRTRRRSSVSSTDSRDTIHAFQPEVTPSTNRLSILYEGSQRRMCFDAEVVEKIRVYRQEGRIEVLFQAQLEDSKVEETDDGGTLLPKGFLVRQDTGVMPTWSMEGDELTSDSWRHTTRMNSDSRLCSVKSSKSCTLQTTLRTVYHHCIDSSALRHLLSNLSLSTCT